METIGSKRREIEIRFRENAKVAGLWPRVFVPPGQPTILAMEVIATGGEAPAEVDGKTLCYFRATIAFEDKELEFSEKDNPYPSGLKELFDSRWLGMMFALWDAVQGESGNGYRNERFLSELAVASDATAIKGDRP